MIDLQPFWHRKYTHFSGTSAEFEPWEIEEEIGGGLDCIFEDLPPQPKITGATSIAAELHPTSPADRFATLLAPEVRRLTCQSHEEEEEQRMKRMNKGDNTTEAALRGNPQPVHQLSNLSVMVG